MAYENVLLEKEAPVAIITLNRPEKLNAISPALENEMHQALDEADADPDVRAIILTGAGRAFSAGYDMSPRDDRIDPSKVYAGDLIKSWWMGDSKNVQIMMHLWYLSKPVIAAVNGWAMGGGCWYTLACDITIASEQAVFAQPEVRHISNTTFLLAALCGWKVAHRFALTGDHIDAQEAYRLGIATQVVPHEELMPTAIALAKRIALVPEASVRLNKAITCFGLEAAGVRAGLLLNGALSALAHSSYGPEREKLNEAMREGGMKAFLEARDGKFIPEPFGPRSKPKES